LARCECFSVALNALHNPGNPVLNTVVRVSGTEIDSPFAKVADAVSDG